MSPGTRLDAFIAISVELTCFKSYELLGTGMAGAYLDTLDKVVGAPVADELFVAYAAVSTIEGDKRAAAMRRSILGNEKVGPIARNIIKLWYVGTWFALPTVWQERFGPADADGTFVVSPTAYIEGLLWRAAGAHPPGARAPGFGSWKHPPHIPEF
jgi:hypothetical protein